MKGKKRLIMIFSLVLMLVLVVLSSVTACSKPAPSPPPAPPPEPAMKYSWNTCTVEALETAGYGGQARFAELVSERSNGQIEVKCHAGCALGDPYNMFENVVIGTQEMACTLASAHFDKRLQVVYMPYIVSTWDEGAEVFGPSGWMLKLLKPMYAEVGLELLGFSYPGMDGYGNTKGTVVEPSDIKELGIKTRVWCTADRLLFEPLGGTVSMPFTDLYTALQTGVCHAQDNAPAATYAQLRDVTEYYTTINWMFEVLSVIINKDLYDSLSPELQNAVQTSMADALAEANARAQGDNDVYLDKMEDYGIQVTRLTPEQLKPWIEHGRSIWPKMEEECGADVVKYVLEHAK